MIISEKILSMIQNLCAHYSSPVATFFSPSCLLCEDNLNNWDNICENCLKILPWIKKPCKICGTALSIESSICGNCLKSPPLYQRCIAACEYNYFSAPLIASLKFKRQLAYANLLAKAFIYYYEQLEEPPIFPEALLPMPLHAKRTKFRGFNQSLEIAKILAKHFAIPIIQPYNRILNTEAQSSLSLSARKKNIKNAFKINKNFSHQHIAIVDDVYTTGATIHELCRSILQCSSIEVSVWVMTKVCGPFII